VNMVYELKEYEVNIYRYDPLLSDMVMGHFGAKPLRNGIRKWSRWTGKWQKGKGCIIGSYEYTAQMNTKTE
jgi:hypothetical protein